MTMYRVGDMAAMTGVTVRTLHHYDSVGLVRPQAHTEGGQRLYSEQDVLRLQHIVALRYLGFPLEQIRELLEREGFDMEASLNAQQKVIEERISELEQARGAIRELLDDRDERPGALAARQPRGDQCDRGGVQPGTVRQQRGDHECRARR